MSYKLKCASSGGAEHWWMILSLQPISYHLTKIRNHPTGHERTWSQLQARFTSRTTQRNTNAPSLRKNLSKFWNNWSRLAINLNDLFCENFSSRAQRKATFREQTANSRKKTRRRGEGGGKLFFCFNNNAKKNWENRKPTIFVCVVHYKTFLATVCLLITKTNGKRWFPNILCSSWAPVDGAELN